MTLKDKLNYYGSKKEPFFFVIDFDMVNFDVIALKDLPDDIMYQIEKKIEKKHKITQLDITPIKLENYKIKF